MIDSDTSTPNIRFPHTESERWQFVADGLFNTVFDVVSSASAIRDPEGQNEKDGAATVLSGKSSETYLNAGEFQLPESVHSVHLQARRSTRISIYVQDYSLVEWRDDVGSVWSVAVSRWSAEPGTYDWYVAYHHFSGQSIGLLNECDAFSDIVLSYAAELANVIVRRQR